MTYYNDTKKSHELVEWIANTLISGASWSDGDGSWTTTDPNDARRCLYHTDGLYFAIESINTNRGTSPSFRGWRISFSETWSAGAPVDPLQSTIQFMGENQDLSTIDIQYHIWIEDGGFALIANPISGANRGAWTLIVERNSLKFYTDSESNFFCFNDCGNYNDDNEGEWSSRHVIRPWKFEGNSSNTAGRLEPMPALKSIGNGVGYFVYPIYFNDINNRLAIIQSSMSISFSTALGLVDGDILAIQGSTKKFIMCSYQGSGSGQYIGIQYTV